MKDSLVNKVQLLVFLLSNFIIIQASQDLTKPLRKESEKLAGLTLLQVANKVNEDLNLAGEISSSGARINAKKEIGDMCVEALELTYRQGKFTDDRAVAKLLIFKKKYHDALWWRSSFCCSSFCAESTANKYVEEASNWLTTRAQIIDQA